MASEDLRDLEELGLLPKEALEDVHSDEEKTENVVPFTGSHTVIGGGNEGLPWFQELVEVGHSLKLEEQQTFWFYEK